MPPTKGEGPARRRPSRSSDAIRNAAKTAAGGELGSEQQASAAAPPTPPLRGRDRSPGSGEWWDRDDSPDEADLSFDPTKTLGDWLEGLIPAEAQGHFINAGKEFAAGVQVTVDHHLKGRKAEQPHKGPIRIEIE